MRPCFLRLLTCILSLSVLVSSCSKSNDADNNGIEGRWKFVKDEDVSLNPDGTLLSREHPYREGEAYIDLLSGGKLDGDNDGLGLSGTWELRENGKKLRLKIDGDQDTIFFILTLNDTTLVISTHEKPPTNNVVEERIHFKR